MAALLLAHGFSGCAAAQHGCSRILIRLPLQSHGYRDKSSNRLIFKSPNHQIFKSYKLHTTFALSNFCFMAFSKVHNFNSGPAILPDEVFEQSASAVLNYNDTGLSILEIGHRTPAFVNILTEARLLVRELLELSDQQEVLFLSGGASTQFMQVPMNLLDTKECAAFTDTGVWGQKAIKEAAFFGRPEIVCSGKENGYTAIPKDFAIPNDAKYLHITSNETIYGTQWKKIPATSNHLVVDMSSDIFSRVMPHHTYGIIYAGAQKNLGAAGTTLVVVNKNLLGKVKRKIPTILDYNRHIEEGNLLNTPPVFNIYVCLLVLRWIKKNGGLAAMEELNKTKAALLYDHLDNSKIFEGTVAEEDRSMMNICFRCKNQKDETAFLDFATNNNIVGIAGHRLAGAFRASLYNAMPISSVEYLIGIMKEYEDSGKSDT